MPQMTTDSPEVKMQLEALTRSWKAAKEREEQAKAERLAIEAEGLELVKAALPDKGTTTFDTGLKIETGFTESWDQERVQLAHDNWPSNLKFPFKGEWKPDNKAISYIRDNEPLAYRLLSDCLTLKPKKPAFSVKGE